MSDQLSSTKHAEILQDIIEEKLEDLKPLLSPKMFMLGGQPGAGKSGIRKAITDNPMFKDALVIDPDELRNYHPKYLDFVKENPDTAAGRVHPDAAKWAAELRSAAIKKKVNIIFDGTLGGNPSAAVDMAKEASKGGFDVEVHVAAVSLEISQQGVRKRYEEASKAFEEDHGESAPPRNVPDNIQRNSYKKVPDAIEALAATGVVSRIRIADRGGKALSDTSGKFAVKKDGGKAANNALKEERTRPWTPKEIEAYEKTGKETEKLLEERLESLQEKADELEEEIEDEGDKDKKKELVKQLATIKKTLEQEPKALASMKKQRQDVVTAKQLVLQSKRPKQDEWIIKYTPFRFPVPVQEGV